MTDPLWNLVLALALVGCSLLAYSLRILDALGSIAAFVLGGAILAAGGLDWFSLMVVFTGIAFVATRFGSRRKRAQGTMEANEGERGAPNVIANGAAPALAAASIWFVEPTAATVAYVAAVCAIMSDTLASEVGGMSGRARRILPPFDRLPPGTNGAVSWIGQLAAALGPVAIAATAVLWMDVAVTHAAIAAGAGFVGCQIDSVIGILWEKDPEHPDRPLGKGDVNFIASVIPMLVVLLVFQFAATV